MWGLLPRVYSEQDLQDTKSFQKPGSEDTVGVAFW